MTKQEVYQLLKDDPSVFRGRENSDGTYRLTLHDGLGWVDIDETETIVWDDLECQFSEGFDHTNLTPEQVKESFDIATSNLCDEPKDWESVEEDQEE